LTLFLLKIINELSYKQRKGKDFLLSFVLIYDYICFQQFIIEGSSF